MNLLQIFLGSIFILFGFFGTAVGILGILDPAGMKAADDGDPFGVPPSIFESSVFTAIFVLILIFGVWVVAAKQQESK
ncbi:MAG: hypothetical protein WKF92_00080 [Pyrinomonadaceae bacterium]